MLATMTHLSASLQATDTIVFEGTQAPLFGRAAFLTFCCFFAFGSLALVLTIVEQQAFGQGSGLGNIWYASTLLSPIAGKFYLDNAERTEQVSNIVMCWSSYR